MSALSELFSRRWILREKTPELYYRVKDQLPMLRPFLKEKMGLSIIENQLLIKLEKTADIPRIWMGIDKFVKKEEYVFLCLILAFLEDLSEMDKFTLSQLTDYLLGSYRFSDLDWTIFSYRVSLVRVLNFLVEEGMLTVSDMRGSNFSEDMTTEVLYENQGTSKYFLRHLDYRVESKEDLIATESDVDEYQRMARRQRAYRKILLDLAVYRDEGEEDFQYLKNYRYQMEKDLEEILEGAIHIHKSAAFFVLEPEESFGSIFPDTNNRSEVVLLLAASIRKRVEKGLLTLEEDDTIRLDRLSFEALLHELHRESKAGFTAALRRMTPQEFGREIEAYLSDRGFISCDSSGLIVRIRPIFGKLSGYYPAQFLERGTASD